MILIGYKTWAEYISVPTLKDTIQLGGLHTIKSSESLRGGRNLFLDDLKEPIIISQRILVIPSKFRGKISDLLSLGDFEFVISSNLRYVNLVKYKNISIWYTQSYHQKMKRTERTIIIKISTYLEI